MAVERDVGAVYAGTDNNGPGGNWLVGFGCKTDGTFTAPPNQSDNISAMRLDTSTGRLTPIAGFSLCLRGRLSDQEVTPHGNYLIVSSLNAASTQLPDPIYRYQSILHVA